MKYDRFTGVYRRFSIASITFVFGVSIFAAAALPILLSQVAKAATPDVVINEIFPGTGGATKWVELYNTTNAEIDLDDWRIVRGSPNLGGVIHNETIPAYGYYVQEFTSSMPLNGGSTPLQLRDGNPSQGTTIDTATYPDLNTGESYGRSPDGSDNWVVFTTDQVTKNTANYVSAPTPAPLDAPTLQLPTDGSVFRSSQLPTAQDWTSVSGATKYRYESCLVDPGDSDCPEASVVYSTETTASQRIVGTTAPEGLFWWHVKALNSDTESAWSEAWTFSVDNTAPVVAITTPADSFKVGDSLNLTGTVDDPAISEVSLTIDGDTPVIVPVSGGVWTYAGAILIAVGDVSVTAEATDAAGNTGSAATVFTVGAVAGVNTETPASKNTGNTGSAGPSRQPQPQVLAVAFNSTDPEPETQENEDIQEDEEDTTDIGEVISDTTDNGNDTDTKEKEIVANAAAGFAWYWIALLLALAAASYYGYRNWRLSRRD